MNHPLVGKRKQLLLYLGTWIIIAIIHVLILWLNFNILFYNALIDSVVYNMLFAMLGIIVWFPVFYNERSRNEIINILLTQLLAGAIIVGLWYTLASGIIELLKAESPRYNSFLSGAMPWRIPSGIFYYVLITLTYYLILFYGDIKEKVKRETDLKQLVTEAELQSLRSQINPHFLFNSLNSINTLTMLEPEKAQQMIIKLSEYMRYSLRKDKNTTVPLHEELRNINLYLDIEKIRFGKKLLFDISLDDNILNAYVPHMILQPIVENAVKYGVYESFDENHIAIDIAYNQNYLVIHVQNDFDPEVQSPGEGVGLTNIRKRLKLIYQQENLLTTSVNHQKFSALLRIPANNIGIAERQSNN